MKVKDMIAKLSEFDPEAEVVQSAFDHTYRFVQVAGEATAVFCKNPYNRGDRKILFEYYGEGHDECEAKISVIVLE